MKETNNNEAESMEVAPASPERPITTSNHDDLDRGPFVKRLRDALISRKTKKSTRVVVGVTGSWGSGKSSILNLVYEDLKAEYPKAIVVRFDPWLVSGRNELIGQFFAEFIGTLNTDESLGDKAKNLAQKVASYGALVSPMGNLLTPGLGSIIEGVSKAAEKLWPRNESLFSHRKQLFKDLEDIDVPIVVFIDELDRVEDEEIRSVAQLVRSVVDFPNVSYLLAFDSDRVAEALEGGKGKGKGRGQAYLEKIVQFQIPLPITFDDELLGMLKTEIEKLLNELGLPADWHLSNDFKELIAVLIPGIIRTPRDVKRLVGVFHVLALMVGNEVEWFDILGMAALQIKAPDIVDRIRVNPDWVVEDPSDALESMSVRSTDMSQEDKLSRVMGEKDSGHLNTEKYDALSKVLSHLFPFLNDDLTDREIGHDHICMRQPLLTTLRLGLIPGVVSKDTINDFLARDREGMEEELRAAFAEDRIKPFLDKLESVYPSSSSVNHLDFWHAVSAFSKKPERKWMREDSPMPEIIRQFSSLFQDTVKHSENFKNQARDIFFSLLEEGDISLTANLMCSHMIKFGLFGRSEREEKITFLEKDEAEDIIKKTSADYKTQHLAGDWITSLWSLQPVYNMNDTGDWDDDCKKHMDYLIDGNDGLDGFTLMLFGGIYESEKKSIKKIVSYDKYVEQLRARLKDESDEAPHETVRGAIKKALGEF